MAQTTLSPVLVQAVGAFTQIVVGVGVGVSTTNLTTDITVPQFLRVKAVIVTSATSATAAYCDTVSGNLFTVTHASGDKFAYVAFGDPKV